ncbi:MAG TPA: hypothetical protein VGM94_02265 [Galbitalea sp.]|jgi:hypothetical protein
MANDAYADRTDELHRLIAASSDNGKWTASADDLADWQRDVLARILLLAADQEVQYLSLSKVDDDHWDFVAFTDDRVVRVFVADSDAGPARLEATTFARSSLESLELLDTGPISNSHPSALRLIGHYRSASISLPLDKFASTTNRGNLERLLQTLLYDVAQSDR